ncbi:MAG: redoxin domain-containing protein [Phycisphaerae bacterium]
MSRMGISIALLASLATGAWADDKLGVGDAAPPLKIAKWMQGSPVDVQRGKETLYVVEFWATWCGPCKMTIPHLSELQRHFGETGKVTVVGISNEEADVVKPFLQAWKDRMTYTVAVDDDNKTSDAYMKAAGQNGIPCAFLVRGGKVLWIGHPMEMDEQIVKLTGDKKWGELAEAAQERLKKQMELRGKIGQALRDEDGDAALASIDSLLKLNPQENEARMLKYQVMATLKGDTAATAEYGHALIGSLDDAGMLNALAWTIMTDDRFEKHRDLKVAAAAAEKADKLSGSADPSILDTLALSQYKQGHVDQAIETEKKAVKLCKNAGMKKQLQKSLKKFENAKAKGGAADKDDDDDDDDD